MEIKIKQLLKSKETKTQLDFFIEEIKQGNIDTTIAVLNSIQQILVDRVDDHLTKINAMYLAKDCMEIFNEQMIELTKTILLPKMEMIAIFAAGKPDSEQGKQLFSINPSRQNFTIKFKASELQMLGDSFMRLILECIWVWSLWFPLDKNKELSHYTVLQMKLSVSGVKFPRLQYFNPQSVQGFQVQDKPTQQQLLRLHELLIKDRNSNQGLQSVSYYLQRMKDKDQPRHPIFSPSKQYSQVSHNIIPSGNNQELNDLKNQNLALQQAFTEQSKRIEELQVQLLKSSKIRNYNSFEPEVRKTLKDYAEKLHQLQNQIKSNEIRLQTQSGSDPLLQKEIIEQARKIEQLQREVQKYRERQNFEGELKLQLEEQAKKIALLESELRKTNQEPERQTGHFLKKADSFISNANDMVVSQSESNNNMMQSMKLDKEVYMTRRAPYQYPFRNQNSLISSHYLQ